MQKFYKPGDRDEWDVTYSSDATVAPSFDVKTIGDNIIERTLITAPQLSNNLSAIDEYVTRFEKSLGISREKIDILLWHIKTYGERAIDQIHLLSQQIELPVVVIKKVLKILLVTLALATAGTVAYNGISNTDSTEKSLTKKQKRNTKTIDVSELSGYGQTKISRYMGALIDASDQDIMTWDSSIFFTPKTVSSTEWSEDVENKRTVNYHENLKKLRQHKFDRNEEAKSLAAMTWVYEDVIVPLAEKGKPFTKYSVEERSWDIDAVITSVNKNIDWKMVCNLTWVKAKHADDMEKIFSRMNSQHVLSYTCTELFGDLPGEFSIHYLDFLFKYAGKEYVYYIPAVYDKMASFGPYQLTSAVVRNDWKYGSANTIQKALPANMREVPWSMKLLTPDQQNQATYLNMIYNLATLFRILEKNNIAENKIEKLADVPVETILQYLAVSHNSPKVATKAALKRIRGDMKNTYESYTAEKMPYAQRTTKFFEATKTYNEKQEQEKRQNK